MTKLDYERSFLALKSLANKDLEPGTKDVSSLFRLSLFRLFQ